ncbi:ComEC family competence protein [bacterium]|nr:ComEC family competence protein [bacterium]
MIKKIANYITENLSMELHNFPLWIPVFIACGIGFYFHLYNEPRAWLTYSIFGLSLFILIFVNFGNSSDKIKKYKKIFAWSTLKYIIKKLFKFAVFLFFIPILGNITIFLLIGGWIYAIFEYSKFLKYFALLYDNALIKEILKGLNYIFSPIIKYIKKTFLFTFSKDVVKTSKSKKNKNRKLLKLLISKTKSIYNFISRILKKFFHNPLFQFIFFINKKVREFLYEIKEILARFINFFIPQHIIDRTVKFIFSLNFILFFFVLGFFIIKLRTDTLHTKLLFKKLEQAEVSARLIEVEYFDRAYRFTLDKVTIENYPDVKLDKIRVKLSAEHPLPQIGSTISFTTTLLPPFSPVAIGGFDFARYSYYKKLSASGKVHDQWIYSKNQISNTFFEKLYFKFLNMRDGINKKIQKLTSSDTSGVIMSMMTGERNSIPEKISNNYKNSGIAHLLSISGIHMTLIVGAAFFFIRLLFAFCMPVASKYNTKKIAVFFALCIAIFYLFLSGARLPTQRAFIMILFVLIAILLDRSPFSLRFLSITAIFILLISPEALINAGFQMSFLAVITLIKLYELRTYWLIPIKDKDSLKGRALCIVNILWANILTAFFTGITISPIVIYNFHNFQIYSILGNFFAIPICSIIVMPSILFSFLLMPFNAEWITLKITETGVSAINFIAENIANLPYSSIDVRTMSTTALLFIVGGFLWLFLWNRRWRFFGLIPIATGLYLYIFAPLPSLLVNKYAQHFGIVSNNMIRILSYSNYPISKMQLDSWKEITGIKNTEKIKDKIFFNINGLNIAIINKYSDYKRACEGKSKLIITTFDSSKSYYKCNKLTFDKRFFYNAQGTEFFFTPRKVHYKTVSAYLGHRPWNIADWKQDYTIPKDILKDLKIFK